MAVASAITTVVLVTTGLGCALAGAYLAVLAVAARFHDPSSTVDGSALRLTVVVPAHDERDYLARCLRSLLAQDHPFDRYDIVVVADNCSDDTAAIARACGVAVLERHDPDAKGKGHALQWAIDRLLADRPDIDGLVVVDADSVAERHLLAGLAARLAAGADVVQGEYLALPDGGRRSELRAAAFLLFHRVRFGGRAVFGMPCHLVGNGMGFSRRVLEAHPWRAHSAAEDLEWSADLRLAGVAPVFAGDARVRAPVAGSGRAAATQRVRWEGGRLHVVRTRLPRLFGAVLHGRWRVADAIVELLVPPLGVLCASSLAGLVLSAGLVAFGDAPTAILWPWIVAVGGVVAYVVVGLWAARAPRSTWRALAAAPAMLIRDTRIRLGFVRGTRAGEWHRTERPADQVVAHRAVIAGVPVDRVDLDGAVDRALDAVRSRTFTQFCTVNLDFIVNARRQRAVRDVLTSSDVNIADGSPVVWLSRLTRERLPCRAAGSDLVPRLASAAADAGASLFLLGGDGGVARDAADILRRANPGLQIAGVYEPPIAPLERMDDTEILRRLGATRPDILLVAFGHPKQDLWIARNRGRLPVSVAIGVGCTFDLLAGRRQRAPVWMQVVGLEWLFRVAHEPTRLFRRYLVDACWLLAVLVPMSLQQRLVARHDV